MVFLKKRKKSKRARIEQKLDKAFSEYIIARDKRCVICGDVKDLQCGHLFTREARSVRWDPRNAFAQCPVCNIMHEEDSSMLTAGFIYKYGTAEYAKLKQAYHTPKKYNIEHLINLISFYESAKKDIQDREKKGLGEKEKSG